MSSFDNKFYFEVKAKLIGEKSRFCRVLDKLLSKGHILSDLEREKKEVREEEVARIQQELEEFYEKNKDKTLRQIKIEKLKIDLLGIGFLLICGTLVCGLLLGLPFLLSR